MARRRGTGGGRGSGVPNPVDVHVGARVRLRRTLLGMSQEKLGESLGLTFQQVQKYERGFNRIGASRLYDIARILDVPVAFFFDDMSDDVSNQAPSQILGLEEDAAEFERDPLAKRESLEFVRAYYKISDPALRKRVFDFVKALAASEEH